VQLFERKSAVQSAADENEVEPNPYVNIRSLPMYVLYLQVILKVSGQFV
jgi:hypothetical protein